MAKKAKRPLPCVHLGEVLERVHCNCPRKVIRECLLHLHGGRVSQASQCERCDQYEPENEEEERRDD